MRANKAIAIISIAAFSFVVTVRLLFRSGSQLDLAAIASAVREPKDVRGLQQLLSRIASDLPTIESLELNPRLPEAKPTSIAVFTVDTESHEHLRPLTANCATIAYRDRSVIVCDVDFLDTLYGWNGSGEESLAGFEVWGNPSAPPIPESLVKLAILHECGHANGYTSENDADEFAIRAFIESLPEDLPLGPYVAMCLDDMAHIFRTARIDPGQASIDVATGSATHPPYLERAFRMFRLIIDQLPEDDETQEERRAIISMCSAYAHGASTAMQRVRLSKHASIYHAVATASRSLVFPLGLRFRGYLKEMDAFLASTWDEKGLFAVHFSNGSVTPIQQEPEMEEQVRSEEWRASIDSARKAITLESTADNAITDIALATRSGELDSDYGAPTFPIGGKPDLLLCVTTHRLYLVNHENKELLNELIIPGLDRHATVIPSQHSTRVFVLSPRILGQASEVSGAIYELRRNTSWGITVFSVMMIVVLVLLTAGRRSLVVRGSTSLRPTSE